MRPLDCSSLIKTVEDRGFIAAVVDMHCRDKSWHIEIGLFVKLFLFLTHIFHFWYHRCEHGFTRTLRFEKASVTYFIYAAKLEFNYFAGSKLTLKLFQSSIYSSIYSSIPGVHSRYGTEVTLNFQGAGPYGTLIEFLGGVFIIFIRNYLVDVLVV